MASAVVDGRRQRLALIGLVAAAVLLVDQLTKWWALNALDDRNIDLFWTLRLNLVFNTGAAFGRFDGFGPLIAIIVIVVIGVVIYTSRRAGSKASLVGLGLILGGALGNFGDRLFRSGNGFLGGAVVDFIDFQWWPVFNVADAAIVVGVIVLALFGLVREHD